MTSKLPVPAARRNLNFEFAGDLAAKLERTLSLRNDKIYQHYGASFDGDAIKRQQQLPKKSQHSVSKQARKSTQTLPPANADSKTDALPPTNDKAVHDRITHANFSALLAERDEHIDKLIAHLDELHAHNERFAADNERLISEASRPCHACSDHAVHQRQLQAEIDHQTDLNTAHTQDVRMLKTLVYRLNVQLERHQDQLRRLNAPDEAFANPDIAPGATDPANTSPATSWGAVNTHTLAPLLNAYSAQIAEQRTLIAQYEQDATHFTGRLKQIIDENETIHAAHDQLRTETVAWQTERVRLRSQLECYRDKADVQSRRADLAKQKLVEVLRCYEQKVQSQSIDLERLQEAYGRVNGELTGLRAMQQNPERLVESLRECQRLFEELKGQHDADRAQLATECERLRVHCREVEERMALVATELADVRRTADKREGECVELNKKMVVLRQSLARVRLSREAFRTRVKQMQHHQQQLGQHQYAQIPASDADVELMLRQRTLNAQTEVHGRYMHEIETLTRRLQQRDDTLRRVLQAKVGAGDGSKSRTKEAAQQKQSAAVITAL